MGKAKITITGVASKPPKIRDDKTVDLLLKVDSSPSVPKGLKPLGQSICLITVNFNYNLLERNRATNYRRGSHMSARRSRIRNWCCPLWMSAMA